MQGFNMGRYVPPEHEGTTSANKLANKHALGARARKVGQGILTVRFEMPFAIWCTTCPKPTIIGQGVRFNAEKKKVGNYHSTPIYSFRMKHTGCGGAIEIRTDPRNTAYVVTEGAKKRDTGEERDEDGVWKIGIKTDEEKARLENDAFAALEGQVEDKRQAGVDKSRIEELYSAKEKDWDDPGEANRRLRRAFRAERKVRQRREGVTEALKDRMSLGMELLEETEEDRRRAKFVDFGESGAGVDGSVVKATARPLFAGARTPSNSLAERIRTTRRVSEAEQRKEKLRKELGNNTRAILDPFLSTNRQKPTTTGISLIRRQRSSADEKHEASSNPQSLGNIGKGAQVQALVDYDSD